MNQNLPPSNSKKLPKRPVSSVTGEEFLKSEYELLNQWAIHGENVTHRIFNFYITILTTVLGGLVLLIQILLTNIQESLLIISGVCGFLVIIGVIFFDGLVSQYIRNVYYYFGMQSIRDYFQRYEEIKPSLLKTPTIPIDKEMLAGRLMSVKFGFPGGNQLVLIETMNSILAVVVLISLIWGIGGIGFRPMATILSSIICFFIILVTHKVLRDLMIKRNMAQMSSSLYAPKIIDKR